MCDHGGSNPRRRHLSFWLFVQVAPKVPSYLLLKLKRKEFKNLMTKTAGTVRSERVACTFWKDWVPVKGQSKQDTVSGRCCPIDLGCWLLRLKLPCIHVS